MTFKRVVHVIAPMALILLAYTNVSPLQASNHVDQGPYAYLLSKYVHQGTVDYQGLKSDEGRLDTYLQILEAVKPESLTREQALAFYINAYNAWTLKLVLGAYPGVTSIKELGSVFKSPWKKEIVRIDGRVLTLDALEHEILRPRFKDPRIHFAVNCASKSCPPLRSEPYVGDEINRQLDEMTSTFLNDSTRNRLEGSTLWVSRIFKWYAGDFDDDIVGFFVAHAGNDLASLLKTGTRDIEVAYLDYDWSLNGR